MQLQVGTIRCQNCNWVTFGRTTDSFTKPFGYAECPECSATGFERV